MFVFFLSFIFTLQMTRKYPIKQKEEGRNIITKKNTDEIQEVMFNVVSGSLAMTSP